MLRRRLAAAVGAIMSSQVGCQARCAVMFFDSHSHTHQQHGTDTTTNTTTTTATGGSTGTSTTTSSNTNTNNTSQPHKHIPKRVSMGADDLHIYGHNHR